MNVLTYIDPSIPFLKTTDTVEKGLDWMEEYKISNLPVVEPEHNKYLGLVSELVLQNEARAGLLIKDLLFYYENKSVLSESHIYEAFSLLQTTGVDVLSVVNKEGIFVGLLSSKTLLKAIAVLTSASEHGGVIELVMNSYDYSLVEIARAVESNGGKILSSYVANVGSDLDKIKVVLKMNINDLSLVVSEFHQLNYEVQNVYSDFELPNDTLDNYAHLVKYLDL